MKYRLHRDMAMQSRTHCICGYLNKTSEHPRSNTNRTQWVIITNRRGHKKRWGTCDQRCIVFMYKIVKEDVKAILKNNRSKFTLNLNFKKQQQYFKNQKVWNNSQHFS